VLAHDEVLAYGEQYSLCSMIALSDQITSA
jgi:hypothetical protein